MAPFRQFFGQTWVTSIPQSGYTTYNRAGVWRDPQGPFPASSITPLRLLCLPKCSFIVSSFCCHCQTTVYYIRKIIGKTMTCFDVFYMGLSRPLLSLFFLLFLNVQMVDKICRCWDLNHRSLVSEATALPTEPQPLPMTCLFQTVVYVTNFSSIKHRIVSSIVLSVK